MEVTVSYRYSNKVDSAKDAPWEGAEVSITSTVDELMKDRCIEDLFKETKLQVWAELGVQFNQDEENGTLKPVNIIHAQPAKRSYPPKAQTQNYGASSNSGGGLTSKHPDLPTFDMNGATFVDFREAKLGVNAVVKPGFPDFKSDDYKQSYWMINNDGVESQFYQDIKAAGLIEVGANA